MRLDKYKTALRQVSTELEKRGVEFVLVGSAVLPITYGLPYDPRDVDLFVINKSTIMDSELFEEIARENDWDVGTSEHGTIYYEIVAGGETVHVDLLENILDIYIPPEFFSETKEVNINGAKVRSIGLEELLVLKARIATKDAEDFINEIARLIAEHDVKLDYDKIRRLASLYEDVEGILKRLRRNGIYVD